jgi:hypothetical protein
MHTENPESNSLESRLSDLRNQIHLQQDVELARRRQEGRPPTEEEMYLGAFSEEIEPQVREAIFTLVKKGYEFCSSGFGGQRKPKEQHLLGFFTIDNHTQQALNSIGVTVETRTDDDNQVMTELSFKTDTDNLQAITDKWNIVADLLPKVSDAMILSRGYTSRSWRSMYASNRPDLLILDLERQMQNEALPPAARNRIERTIEKLNMQQRLQGTLPPDEREWLQRAVAEIEEVEADEEAVAHDLYLADKIK